MIGFRRPTVLGDIAERISIAIDSTYPPDIAAELRTRRRVDKIGEEHGEVIEALNGVFGENPRKGVTHTVDDLVSELLDVALCALAATAHVTGHTCDPALLLEEHAAHIHQRLIRAIQANRGKTQ